MKCIQMRLKKNDLRFARVTSMTLALAVLTQTFEFSTIQKLFGLYMDKKYSEQTQTRQYFMMPNIIIIVAMSKKSLKTS